MPSDEELDMAGLSREQVNGWTFMAGRGCGHCRGGGHKGRKAVAEVLVLNDMLREMIACKAPISALKEHAAKAGMRSLREAAWAWVARGETTLDEVGRVAG